MSFLFTISSIFRMTNVQVELMQRALHVDRLVCEPDKSGSDSSVSRKRRSGSSVSEKNVCRLNHPRNTAEFSLDAKGKLARSRVQDALLAVWRHEDPADRATLRELLDTEAPQNGQVAPESSEEHDSYSI